jgi:hypothetical protein
VFNQAVWNIQGVQFVTNLKVLSLPYYDIILGMDWLELHSPMYIDWVNKWMTVNIDGQTVQLHCLQPSLPENSLVELCLVHTQQDDGEVSCYAQQEIPAQLQQLLKSFEHVFQDPQSLPPSRPFDHSIHLYLVLSQSTLGHTYSPQS